MVRVQLAAEEFRLAVDAESGAFLGVLKTKSKLAHPLSMRRRGTPSASARIATEQPKKTCLESERLQTDCQAWERLVAGAGFGDDSEAGGRAIIISGGDLDAGDGCRLV